MKNGPLRQEIEAQGGIKLIYIDPPFDIGANFSIDIEVGDASVTKKPSVLEEIAYRDTWGKGTDGFMSMIYERLKLMRDILAEDGTIFVHCDWRATSCIRLMLDEIFGSKNLINEVIWKRQTSSGYKGLNSFGRNHDTIWFYSKRDNYNYQNIFQKYRDEYVDTHYNKVDQNGRKYRTHWVGTKTTQATIEKGLKTGRYVKKSNGSIEKRLYLDEQPGVAVDSVWTDIKALTHGGSERFDYPTQKPESLLERIINATTSKGDMIADFFMGSGTTLAVAEKLDRKWIGSDIGRFAIHTTRKRMLKTQRELKHSGETYRAFEILNLGKYERQAYFNINPDLEDPSQKLQQSKHEQDFIQLILQAYKAKYVSGFEHFVGSRNNRMVVIGPLDSAITRRLAESSVDEALANQISKIDILGFEFEMGLAPQIQDEAKQKGVDLVLKYIPREVFPSRAIDNSEVVFHDLGYLEVKPLVSKRELAIELTGFSVFYNQDSVVSSKDELKPGGSRVEVRNGQIYRISRDKNSGITEEELITQSWTDWIDYWAVDFDFQSRKEIIRQAKGPDQEQVYEEIWTGNYVFENEWQSFRTKKDRSIKLTSARHEYLKTGLYKVAVKVIDIFGNDTTKVIDVRI